MKNKSNFLSVIMLWCINTIFAQPISIEWQKTFGGSNSDECQSVQQTSDGGYILAGYSKSTDGDVIGNNGSFDYWIVKINAQGQLVWQTSLGGTDSDFALEVKQTSDGGYVAAGFVQSNDGDVSGSHGYQEFWIVKLTSTGNTSWKKIYGGSLGELAYDIQQTTDGGFIVVGQTNSNNGDVSGNHGNTDYWVIRLDPAGNLVWQKTYGGSSNELSFSVKQTPDGGFVIAGGTMSSDGQVTGFHGGLDVWLIKIDAAGNLQWQKAMGGSEGDNAQAVSLTSDGGYILTGLTASYDGDVTGFHGKMDMWVVKTDAFGNIQWQKAIGYGGEDSGFAVEQTSDGGYIVGGMTTSIQDHQQDGQGIFNYLVVKLTSTGTTAWQKEFGGTADDQAYDLQQTSDGGYIVSGFTSSNDGDVIDNHGDKDFWLVKLGYSNPCSGHKVLICHNGKTICVDTHAVVTHLEHGDFVGPCDSNRGLHDHFSQQNPERIEIYPNPNHGQFTVMIPLEAFNGNGIAEIITSDGKVITKFIFINNNILDVHLSQPGMYFVRILNDNMNEIRKVIVEK